MGNAVNELKKIADVIVPPVDKDGLADGLENVNTRLLTKIKDER